MRRARCVLLLCLIAACGGRQRVETLEDKRVRIRVEGNDSVSTGTLLEGLTLTRLGAAGQGFDPYLVAVDEDRLRGFYLRRGHFRAEVRSEIDDRGREVDVLFRISEGPRARLARVEIAGLPDDPAVSRDEIRDLIPIADGEEFDYLVYDEVKPRLLAGLERAGYAHARLDATVAADRARHEAIIRLEFEPGPLCEFGEVELLGVEGELAEAARARLKVRPGGRFSTTALEETQAGLYDMGRFAVVRVEPDRTEPSTRIPVTIRLTEADAHELRLGGGLGADPESWDVHGRAGYVIAGWPRPLTTTRLEARPALVLQREDSDVEPRVEAVAAIERLDFVVPLLRAEAELQASYLAVEAYTSYGPRFRLGLRYPLLQRQVEVAGGWQIRYLRFRDLDPALDEMTAAELGLDGPYRLGFYEQSVVVDLRDHPLLTRKGIYGELRAEEGHAAAGGAFSYVRLTPELRAYYPLGRVVVAGRVRAGTILGDLPVTQRFFSGGATSQRGFPERRLAPTVTRTVDGEETSVVIGGGGVLETGAELRAPIGRLMGVDIGGVGFLDGGDVTERMSELDPMELHWAAGLGLRFGTVIGPVRFDVGYRLNRTGVGEPMPGDRFAFHLSLGEAF
jgi:translocation and assembly module TamA